MRILLVYYYYYFGCVLSSLLILVDRLFDFMFVLKYGSSTRRPSSSDRLEFVYGWNILVDHRQTTKSLYLYCLIFQRSLLVSRTAGSGWARRLARSACWSLTEEEGAYGDRRTYNMSMQTEILMSSALIMVRPLERSGQVSVRWETGETYSHIESTKQLKRGRRLTKANETEWGISGDLWFPLAYVVRRQRAWRGRTGLPESGWTASQSKYVVQSGRELLRRQVSGVYERERVFILYFSFLRYLVPAVGSARGTEYLEVLYISFASSRVHKFAASIVARPHSLRHREARRGW